MSVNKFLPHVLMFPEDDANRQVANGFVLVFPTRQIQILPEAGGWAQVRDRFISSHVSGMEMHPDRLMVLLIDFDGNAHRLRDVQARIPENLRHRVFVLGAWTEPEALRQAGLGSYETIGRALGEDCLRESNTTWGHELLRHNADELERLLPHIRPILSSAP